MTKHRIVYVECCYGLRVRPAHGCKWIPVCPCGWISTEYHTSQLEASQEGTAHVDGVEYTPPWARTSTRASFVLSGRETPAGYARTAQVQALVDKLSALREARLEVSGYWDNGQEIPDEA